MSGFWLWFNAVLSGIVAIAFAIVLAFSAFTGKEVPGAAWLIFIYSAIDCGLSIHGARELAKGKRLFAILAYLFTALACPLCLFQAGGLLLSKPTPTAAKVKGDGVNQWAVAVMGVIVTCGFSPANTLSRVGDLFMDGKRRVAWLGGDGCWW